MPDALKRAGAHGAIHANPDAATASAPNNRYMKRFVPFVVTAALAVTLAPGAFAKERRSSSTKTIIRTQVIERGVSDAVTGVAETTTVGPNAVLVLPPEPIAETTAAGADTRGVTRSTGSGIGEASTRADVGTGRGGAGLNRAGTLAPSTVRERRVITTVPARVQRTRILPGTSSTEVTVVPGTTTVIEPIIPRVTTNRGTLGTGTSTQVGVAPGK